MAVRRARCAGTGRPASAVVPWRHDVMIERVGPYILDAVIGAGASSQVWTVHRADEGPARTMDTATLAAKVIALDGPDVATTAEAAARLVREAEIVAGLRHPNIVPVIDVVRDDSAVAVVMAYARGGSLATRLVGGPMAAVDVVRLADAMAAALMAVHERGVVHGDVKPDNIVYDRPGPAGVALLTDFGVARLPGASPTDDPVAGTVEYLAPEVVDGHPFGPATDIYGLGITLYEALGGGVPYRGNSALATARLADRADVVPLRSLGVDSDLADVVHRAMARHPTDRFGDAADLRRALAATVIGRGVLRQGSDVGTAPSPLARLGRVDSGTRVFGPRPPLPEPLVPARWPRVAVAVASVAVVTVGAVLGFGAWRSSRHASTACPAVRPAPSDGAVLLAGDTDGDGCPDRVVWLDPLLSVAPGRHHDRARTYEIRAADGSSMADRAALVLGDWACTGIDALGLYDRTTGEVRTFADWGGGTVGARLPAPLVTPGRPGATARIVRGDHHATCDRIVLDP